MIHDRTLGIYNDILVFLLQIKRAKCALDKDFKDEKHAVSSTGSADGAAPRRKSTAWISAPNPRHILLRLELRHVVNNVENYIMTQIHGEATKELERDIAAASNLDQVRRAPARRALKNHKNQTGVASWRRWCAVLPWRFRESGSLARVYEEARCRC